MAQTFVVVIDQTLCRSNFGNPRPDFYLDKALDRTSPDFRVQVCGVQPTRRFIQACFDKAEERICSTDQSGLEVFKIGPRILMSPATFVRFNERTEAFAEITKLLHRNPSWGGSDVKHILLEAFVALHQFEDIRDTLRG